MKRFYRTVFVTFLGALIIAAHHRVPVSEKTGRRRHFIRLVAAGRAEAEHLSVIKLDVKTLGDGGQQAFEAIWLGTNKARWRVRCFNVKQSLTMAALGGEADENRGVSLRVHSQKSGTVFKAK